MNTCRICESNKIENFKIGKFELIKCTECGIIYNKNFPSESELTNYYEQNYKMTNPDSTEIERRRLFRIPEQIQLIQEISILKKLPASILDIGCDKGFFLDEARRYGYNVNGLELSNIGREYCQKQGLIVYKDFSEIENSYDIITMWHSLEHHFNPLKSLENIKNYLKSDGILLIRVPDFDCIWRKIFSSKWIWFQPENHYYHFTYTSLSKILNRAGFDILKIEHRKPNNRFTKKAYKLSQSLFRTFDVSNFSLKKRLTRFYEDTTGVELFAIAKKIV